MKVLFAVSNESISEAIVKKYQREYKEIITYKNVYYFNAILKELQRDKSYDRVVIDEDLEPFTNKNYDAIDKFIFEKLDSISDEASNAGNDIPIILICTERRTRSEQMLVKFFGIGIYNALLGQDRSIDQVCQLINIPRSKKEAKLYYKIESDEVNYQSESEDSVSEIEIQNILAHYKKIARYPERFVDSFNNIAAQYNDAQLRVIVKFLPLSVKTVLEEESEKYQSVMTFGDVRTKSRNTISKQNTQKETLKMNLLKNGRKTLTKPVIVPGVTEVANKNEVKSDQKNKIEERNEPIQQEQILETPILPNIEESVKVEPVEPVKPVKQEKTVEEINETQAQPVKRGRGRPRKVVPEAEVINPQPKRKRGRPRKIVQESNPNGIEQAQIKQEESVLPGFGAINSTEQKEPVLPGFDAINSTEQKETALPGFDAINSKQQEETVLPGFDTINSTEQKETVLPGFDTINGKQQEETALPGFDTINSKQQEEPVLPGFDAINTKQNVQKQVTPRNNQSTSTAPTAQSQGNNGYILPGLDNMQNNVQNNMQNTSTNNSIERVQNSNVTQTNISNLLTRDKKIVSFVGTSKNGTSFIVNNLGAMLSKMGINTAILDMTQNRNSYYIYTQNDENLRKKAYECMNRLEQGFADGIVINKSLHIYTSLPDEKLNELNTMSIIQTLVEKYDLVLVDCDFYSPEECFSQVQEIYLVQSMDILTIQPLTAFLKELKVKDILKEEKIKIIINKEMKVRGLNSKVLIGGMSSYNDPAMSFMTALFNKDTIQYCTIPFEIPTYSKYLEGLVNCEISLNGYSKMFLNSLKTLAGMVYPLINNKYARKNDYSKNNKFSSNMNNTLNQMKSRY